MNHGSYVYFIQQGTDGPIKIGVSTNPVDRFINLQRHNPDKLHMLGIIPGNRNLEIELHQRFQATEIWAEWFNPTSALMDFMQMNITPLDIDKVIRKVNRGRPKKNAQQQRRLPIKRGENNNGITLMSTLAELWEDHEKKQCREISVREVSKATGLAWETINNLREDKTRRFDGDVIAKLCRYFDVPGGEVVPFLCVDYHDAAEVLE